MSKLRATPPIRFLLHALIGGLAGFAVLHPLSLAVFCYEEFGELRADTVYGAFSFEHIRMAFFFSGLGGIIGLLYALYAHRLAALYTRVRELSIVDPLTSLYNRRHFIEVIEGELQRSLRYGRAFSLILIDVDHFKCYNDTHGHVRGDDLLQELASLLRGSLRDVDTLCRYGGEEFAIILPESDSSRAHGLAIRVLDGVSNRSFRDGQTQPLGRVSVSIGLASFPEHAQTVREIMKRADVALYSAKETGRNRVCVYDTSMKSVTESTMGTVS